LGLNLTENTCYLEWYFDGFALTFYTNAATVSQNLLLPFRVCTCAL